MDFVFQPCTTEDDYAKVSLFLLEHKLDLHPSFQTLQMVELLYAYITQGALYKGTVSDGSIRGASAYYIGTPGNDFTDRNVALIDIVIVDRAYRGTRFFFYGLSKMIDWIESQHPDVDEIRMAALAENPYICRLYSKFMTFIGTQEGKISEEYVYSEKIPRIRDALKRYVRL